MKLKLSIILYVVELKVRLQDVPLKSGGKEE